MRTRSVVVSLGLILLLTVVGPVSGTYYHSNTVPGDLRPAAHALGVQEADHAYAIADFLNALVVRIESLTERIEELETRIGALDRPLPLEWVNATEQIVTAHDVTLRFRTEPDVLCHLDVFYPATLTPSPAPAVWIQQTADTAGIVQWTWRLAASAGQPVRISVYAEHPDGRTARGVWTAQVVDEAVTGDG